MTTLALSKIVIDKNLRTINGVEDLRETPLGSFPVDERERILELAETIDVYGLLNPITVKDLGGGKQFRLIAGYRRFKAVQHLGKNVIDSKSIKGKREDEAIVQLVENVQRKDLNPLDVARGLENIRKVKGISKQGSLAKVVGKSAGWVSQHLTLLKSDPEVIASVESGEMGLGAARQISSLPKEEQAGAVSDAKKEAKKVGKKKVSSKGAKRQVAKRKDGKKGKQKVLAPVEEREKEQKEKLVKEFIAVQCGDNDPPGDMKETVEKFWDFLMSCNSLYIQ
jgi:ParB family chromosome partitioning protein